MSIFSRHSSGIWSNTDFVRVTTAYATEHNDETGEDEHVYRKTLRTLKPGTGKHTIILAPMKSLSLEEFSYPFQNTTKIRDALRLQVMPYTQAGGMEIFPVVLAKSGGRSSGIVWYVSHHELDIPSSGSSVRTWPAPLAFVSELSEYGGNGATIWVDEENICSILWQSNRPVMYHWRKHSGENSLDSEVSMYDEYCREREIERGGDYVFNALDGEALDDLPEIVSESVKICAWIPGVNLSRKVLEGARDLERTLRLLAKVSLWILVAGAIVLGGEIFSWYDADAEVRNIRERSEKFYRETFDPERTGRISNPVTLARDKIASLTGKGEEGHPLDEVLADLGEIHSSNKDITIDIIRYNQEGIDCTGTAPDMSSVLNFRRSWEDKANLVQVDNTQFVAGIGYRFDLRIRW